MRRSLMLRTLYFLSSSEISRAFSALCVYTKFRHHPHPEGYLRAKFRFSFAVFAVSVAELTSGEKNGVLTHPLNHPAYLMPREPKLFLRNKQRDWLSPRSEAKASGWLPSAVTTTYVIFFIVECCIARFLCAMHVFKVRNHPHPHATFVPNFVSFTAPVAELTHGNIA